MVGALAMEAGLGCKVKDVEGQPETTRHFYFASARVGLRAAALRCWAKLEFLLCTPTSESWIVQALGSMPASFHRLFATAAQ